MNPIGLRLGSAIYTSRFGFFNRSDIYDLGHGVGGVLGLCFSTDVNFILAGKFFFCDFCAYLRIFLQRAPFGSGGLVGHNVAILDLVGQYPRHPGSRSEVIAESQAESGCLIGQLHFSPEGSIIFHRK